MSTVRSGSALSVTVTMTVSPSATVYAVFPNDTVTCGSSSSVMLTVASVVAPALTRSGSVPKPSSTLSSSSSSSSCVASNLIVCDITPAANVKLDGRSE